MRINLAVIGAGSVIGRHLCRRAVRIGWDVHAYSMYDLQEIYRQSMSMRQRTFYNKNSIEQSNWLSHISWVTDCDYDENFDKLGDEIRNVAGLVYFYEDTPFLKSGETTFEQNVIKLSKLAGHKWSVRHFIAVQCEENGEKDILTNQGQQKIGQTNPFMIVSLLRPGKVYSYSNFSSCLPVYKNRTLQSMGIDTKPINIINAETVATCITTLIHNTNDPNIYRILEGNDIENYLLDQNVPYDSPEYDLDNNNNNNNDNDSNDDDDDKQENKNKKAMITTIGFNDNEIIDNNNNNMSERDDEESPQGKIL